MEGNVLVGGGEGNNRATDRELEGPWEKDDPLQRGLGVGTQKGQETSPRSHGILREGTPGPRAQPSSLL